MATKPLDVEIDDEYSNERKQISERDVPKVDPKIVCDDVLLTQQSAKDECDINIIVERAKRGADVSGLMKQGPTFGDFRRLPDLREAMNLVRDAETRFMQLDAKVRERFGNDPARLIEFVKDTGNRDEAIKLGLIEKPPVADPPLNAEPEAPAARKQKAKPDGD